MPRWLYSEVVYLMAKIVVASYQNQLRTLLKNGITGLPVEEAYNIVEASAFFHPNDINVLIFDLDSGSGATRYLERLKKEFNLIVILTGSDTGKAMDFMRKGFGEFIIKPEDYGDDAYVNEFVLSIVQRIKTVVSEKTKEMESKNKGIGKYSASALIREKNHNFANQDSELVIAIASSTGGTEALPKVLTKLPEDMPPILIVQHFPPNFASFFCQRIDKLCQVHVKVADSFEYIKRGTVYLADGESHMVLKRANGRLAIEKVGGARVNGVMPAADVLFNSVAEVSKDKAIGLVMTGMGCDGAKGLFAMKAMGARTIAQNEQTSIIFGMAKVSKDIGAVDELVALDDIASRLITLSR